MGADWEGSERFELLREHCDLIFIPRTPSISSTQIREVLQTESG
jgi:hypothetical protein